MNKGPVKVAGLAGDRSQRYQQFMMLPKDDIPSCLFFSEEA